MKKRVGLMLTGVTSKNCGGAERFFSDFFSRYTNDPEKENELYFLTDKDTLYNMESLGKLRTRKNLIVLHNWSNRFKNILEPLQFVFLLVVHRISIVQVTSYTESFFARINAIGFLPSVLRPKLAITVVDCEIPYALENKLHAKHSQYKAKYLTLFERVRIDAVMSWYERFLNFSRQHKTLRRVPYMAAVKSRYADIEEVATNNHVKKPLVVWAARLTGQKQPLMLPEAVKWLVDENFNFGGWRFEIYGEGELKKEMEEYILHNKLNNLVKLMGNGTMEAVFPESTCFVSTQDYENFPSMSMMEAMYYSNVIISRNVGQTELMVKEGKNGYLLAEDSAKCLAETLKKFIGEPSRHHSMGQESKKLTREVHTYPNFRKQADAFWARVGNNTAERW